MNEPPQYWKFIPAEQRRQLMHELYCSGVQNLRSRRGGYFVRNSGCEPLQDPIDTNPNEAYIRRRNQNTD